ncbi:hypothetical protein [Dyadobacter pollutisoli]|uniref:Restriction endonuclease n=1 Tax=Dyadobacter pollutisoli TaxID=2910158 RepID=A0A9E8N9H0_9BACT|nr:hypothetical protein [Dyadobacter pollutisoli]WAC11233.1 hypothetical protein ON006_26305 [Dyadobacter pollutisoli]
MTVDEFEEMLRVVCANLTKEVRINGIYKTSSEFELRVREEFNVYLANTDVKVDFDPHPYIFPDIVLGEFGVEVKYTANNTWRSVANSIFESTRSNAVKHIYLLFGKMGGTAAVDWGKYDDCVIHVRTSHLPRFEVEINPKKSLFSIMGLSYEQFLHLPISEKMIHVRKYARARLKEGERLWWLEDNDETSHSLPLQVRLYMRLSQEEKRKLRGEAALLCPQIVKPSRSKGKYDDASIYLLTYHGVLCSQARDLFSAGSVALRTDGSRGGNYLERALQDIEKEMRAAANRLDDRLFVEYWGQSVPPGERIREWLKRADEFAVTWKPSDTLFL